MAKPVKTHQSPGGKREALGVTLAVVGGGIMLLGCLTGPFAILFLPVGLLIGGIGLGLSLRAS